MGKGRNFQVQLKKDSSNLVNWIWNQCSKHFWSIPLYGHWAEQRIHLKGSTVPTLFHKLLFGNEKQKLSSHTERQQQPNTELLLILDTKCLKTSWTDSPLRQRWWYTLVSFYWVHVRFEPVPLASSRKGSSVNSPVAVSFTNLSQTLRRPSYFQNPKIAWELLIYFGYRIASKSEKGLLETLPLS